MLLFLSAVFIVSLFVGGVSESASESRSLSGLAYGESLDVYFFYGEGCPHCVKVKPFLAEIEQKYPLRLHSFDIYGNRSCLSLFKEYSEAHGLPLERRGVPAVFVSDTYIVGDVPILDGLEQVIENELEKASSVDRVLESAPDEPKSLASEALSTPGGLSVVAVTFAALVDAVSPCSIAILVFLVGARVLVADFRKRALKVGLAFSLSVFIAYFLFGLGLFTVVQISGFSNIFSLLAGLIIVLAGIFYLKDIFWYGQGGFVMEVPRSLRPTLMKMLKGVTTPFGAFATGFVVGLFELPCTGGPYLFILGQLANTATRLQAIPFLLYYNFIFVLPLILVSLLLYSNFLSIGKVRGWSDKNKRLLKLAGGFAMIAMGFSVLPVSQMLQFVQPFLYNFRAIGPPLIAFLFLYCLNSSARLKGIENRLTRLWLRRGTCSLIPSVTLVLALVALVLPFAYLKSADASWFNAVSDPGFEAGPPWPAWEQYSTNFGTPITGEAPRAHSGAYWAWFGGIASYELGWIRQTVTIPTSATFLEFWLNIPNCAGGSDNMNVTVDGTVLAQYTNTDPLCGADSYRQEVVFITSFADGGSHTLEFRSETWGQGPPGLQITNFFVDDISIEYYVTSTVVTVSSPKSNASYYKTHVPLNFTVDKQISYAGYSLDKEPEIDITEDTTWNGTYTNGYRKLESIINGSHNITVFANATSGETGSSNTTNFFYCPADFTGPTQWLQDWKVDIYELALIGHKYGTNYGDPDYDAKADLNDDNKIDLSELTITADHYGHTC